MPNPSIEIVPCDAPLGAEVRGANLHEPDIATVEALRDALNTHQVLFFEPHELDVHEHQALGAAFGEIDPHDELPRVDRDYEVIYIDTGDKGTTAEWWHADVTCAPAPPMGSLLHMQITPERGGATHFASMTQAWDALSEPMKRRLEGLTARHDSWWQPRQSSVHPVVRTHPENGRKLLFVNGIFTKRILELPEKDSDALLQELFVHTAREEFSVRHDWAAFELALWDNRATHHRVDNDFGDARRRIHRVTIQGDRPY